MSKAIKCERCKGFSSKFESETVSFSQRKHMLTKEPRYYDKFDLCLRCWDEFFVVLVKWWRKYED